MTTALKSGNRMNIPAVCRIKDHGTATLISPGILLSSKHVMSSAEVASQLTAIFFEGSKKTPVEVKLLPEKLFFIAAHPDYMDYCIVACEQNGISNVIPAKLPLIKSEWSSVREGDTILVVQHPLSVDILNPIPPSGETLIDSGSASSVEVKRFEEILRCRDDVFYLKTSGNVWTAGCPAFNELGQLIGIQSQVRDEGGGVVSRVLCISSIVKHLFANRQLKCIRNQLTFEDIWSTWYTENDVPRIVSIMANFTERDIVRATGEKLCEHACRPNLVESIVDSGGVACVLSYLHEFRDDESMMSLCVRAIWNITFRNSDSHPMFVKGNCIEAILDVMQTYPDNEEIAEFATVTLHNISAGSQKSKFTGPLGHHALTLVHAALQRFKETTVLQKFGLNFFTTLLSLEGQNGETLVKLHIIEYVVNVAKEKRDQVFLIEVIMGFVGQLAQQKKAIELCMNDFEHGSCGGQKCLEGLMGIVIEIMLEYKEMETILFHGNLALWGIGNDLTCRAMILQHPKSYEALKLSLPALIGKARAM